MHSNSFSGGVKNLFLRHRNLSLPFILYWSAEVNISSMYFGANLFCCLKIWVVTFGSNLALTVSQFISLNSWIPIWDLFPKDRQNIMHLFWQICNLSESFFCKLGYTFFYKQPSCLGFRVDFGWKVKQLAKQPPGLILISSEKKFKIIIF